MRKAMLLCLASVTALSLVPGTSGANHCESNLYVFTGQGTTVPQQNPALNSDMLNLGAEGCTVPAAAGHQPDTRYFTPGATKVRVGAENNPLGPGSNNSNKPVSGTIKFNNGAAIPLTWTYSQPSARWNSQILDIPAGTTTITATATLKNDELVASSRTVVYKALS